MLGIPMMQDPVQQALHLLALEPVVETTADPLCATSSRSEKMILSSSPTRSS
jgi:hypothetical protein